MVGVHSGGESERIPSPFIGHTKTIMAYSVNISVEAPIENQIQEISYDGQEIYQAYVTVLEIIESMLNIVQLMQF